MKSWSMTTCVPSILLAAFLATQISPLWASTKDVAGIQMVIKKIPGPALAQVKTRDNGTFSVHLVTAGTYQVTAVGVKNLKQGTCVKLSFSVQSAKPASANTGQAAPVSKTATAVLDASGRLAFPGDIRVSEPSVLTGCLEIAEPMVTHNPDGTFTIRKQPCEEDAKDVKAKKGLVVPAQVVVPIIPKGDATKADPRQ
jgi:hypothetical protein